SRSVAELVFAHLSGGIRFLHLANREMPLEGEANFKMMKKAFKGRELKDKTLGILGFGKIGREVAKIALGIGMKVLVNDSNFEDNTEIPVELSFFDGQKVTLSVEQVTKETLLKTSDFISLHVPQQKDFIIGKEEIKMMKKSAGLINAARGGVVDEIALDVALAEERLSFAALDVFQAEPNPPIKLLMNPSISLSPHVGGSTAEAQERIGVELADQIIAFFGKQN
ncbi:MAG TPA: NAD(P)-dependent oxidoreductase, partial [Flavobacteriaceae bacterium]|nr:NAD(P)-dependent oxidoreductase [Flavobacteriaceae bacterium]